ncbi:MAG: vWA domain-containing protein [Gammaproteobacteria bacterium]
MNLDVLYPWALVLLIFTILPFLSSQVRTGRYSWIQLLPRDRASGAIDIALRLLATFTIVALTLGIAGLYQAEQSVERLGHGAHIVLLLDRSSSMDLSFAGDAPSGKVESKSFTARRLLSEFVQRRENDLFGVAAFSTSAMYVLPLTQHRQATQAAVQATGRRGLAYTNVAKGLAMALSFFEDQPLTGSRVIMLVSDGAAVIDREGQAKLRQWFEKYRPNLYWIFLRSAGTPGIYGKAGEPEEDTPEARPEKYLHKFFKSLKVPYHAYQAEDPQAMEAAIAEVDQLENRPLRYMERIPRKDLAGFCYTAALAGLLLLLAAKTIEVRAWR